MQSWRRKKKKSIFILLFCLLIFCEKNTSDIPENEYRSEPPQNPVVMVFEQSMENAVQEKWNDFLEEYDYSNNIDSLVFDSITCYLCEVKFNPTYPLIFRFPLTDISEENIGSKMLEFYTKWEDLFGLNHENLKFNYFYYNPETAIILVNFTQDKINGELWNFVNTLSISFTINKQGQLIKIYSDLIPNVNLKIPEDCDIGKMCESFYGYSHIYATVYWSYDSVEYFYYTFGEEDEYFSNQGYEVIKVFSSDTLKICAVKGITVTSTQEMRFNAPALKFLFYCIPGKYEIVYIKEIKGKG